MKWNATDTYVACDLWFLWSIFYHVPVRGAHSTEPWHNAVFLDGHARPVYLDARRVGGWGPRQYGQYIPKYEQDFREINVRPDRQRDYSLWYYVPVRDTPGDPFGGTNGEGQRDPTKG
jgi:hypothetical protein